MRIATFFLFFCAFCAVAENVNSQNAKVSIHKSNVPLEEILSEIEAQTDYLFIYKDAVNVKRKTSVNVSGKPVSEVLRSLLEAGLVNSQLTGKHIILSDVPVKTVEGQANQDDHKITVTGRIIDQTGESVIGAAVLEKGTSNGVVTDFDGNFSLKVDAGVTLVISYVGYVSQELKAVSGKMMNIQLKEDTQVLDEVVVMGYTTQSRNTLTGSAVALNEKKLKDVSTANVSSMLDGKVSGVNVSTASGKPGQTSKVQIRGKGSLGSSLDPIWVVDGIIYNSDPRLSPNEIESISILKDAASTALYGSRASNGVIVVTTKKGDSERQSFRVNLQQGISDLSWGNLKMMNSQQLYDYQTAFNTNSWFKPSLMDHNTDWMDLATRQGLYTNVNASYRGGGEKVNSYLLLDFYRETAAVKDMDYSRYTIRSNTDYKIHKNFKAFTRLQGQYVKTNDQSASLYSSYLYLPWDFPYNEDGSIRTGTESDWNGRDKSNYMESQKKDKSSYENWYVSATVGFNWILMKGLTFESNNNVNYKIARDESYVDPTTIDGQSKSGTIRNTYSITSNYFTNQMLRYTTVLGEKHSLQALAAYEYSRYFYQASMAKAKGIMQGKEVIDGTTGMDEMSGSKSAFNIQSLLSNVNYSYDGKYMFQASYRLDGSSKFGKNNRYGSFYTFSGGWNIARENFFESFTSILPELKVRASWGVVGNTPSGNYNHLSLYTAGMYRELPANFPNQLGNPNLGWEKTRTTNVGVDLNLLKRVRLSFDYYDKYTSDLLYNVQLSTLTGYGNQWQNIGAVRNTGVELSVDADVYSNKDWTWTLGFNLGHNKNRIEELYGGLSQISGKRRFEEGRDMDDLWMAEWAGVDPETGSPLWYMTDEQGERVLTKSYTEANKDRVYMGTAAPKLFGGFNTLLSWKNLTMQASFVYSIGGQLYASGRELLDSDGAYDTYNQMVLKKGWTRWEKPGDIATHPKAINGGNASAHKPSSRYLEKADYLTMKNLSVAYAFPKTLLAKLGVNDLTLSFSADNLFTITPYSQVDPVTSGYESNGVGGSSVYPSTRKYVFGLGVSF